MGWKPKRTLAESKSHGWKILCRRAHVLFAAEAILIASGSMHETVECEIRGRRQKVYKHLWPSMVRTCPPARHTLSSDSTVLQRAFWLDSVRRYGKRTYIVFEDQRVTYEDTNVQAVRLATALKRAYGVSKGEEDHFSCFLTLTIFKEIASP